MWPLLRQLAIRAGAETLRCRVCRASEYAALDLDLMKDLRGRVLNGTRGRVEHGTA